jgi:transcriptional regulator with XRE-family HTH domain
MERWPMVGKQSSDIGRRMREIREQRGYSQRDLANRAGLSTNAISRIERGENSPTVSSLHQLATALDVPIVSFFENGEQLATVLVRKNRRLRTRGEGVLIENLGSGLPGQMLEPFLIKLSPGAVCGEEPISHSGEEFVYCDEGEIEYLVDQEWHRLEAGDSLIFQSQQPHLCRNTSLETSVVLIVILPAEGTVQLSQHQHLYLGSSEPTSS